MHMVHVLQSFFKGQLVNVFERLTPTLEKTTRGWGWRESVDMLYTKPIKIVLNIETSTASL